MAQPGYVFIVGCFRTGTTLLRRTLNRSEDVAICGETHFLGGLIQRRFQAKFAKVGDIATDAGAKKVVDYIYTHGSGFWRWWIQKNVDPKEFLRRLLESDRTDRALFSLVMDFFADDRPIRGEKTPSHVYYVPTLLEWFPNAKIIHTFRDPRAIFVSERKKKDMHPRIVRQPKLVFEIFLSLYVLIHWLRTVQLHHRYQRLYPDNYYFIKYEDLISAPETNLKKLCDFLEINFSEAMLQQKVVNSSFVPRNERVKGFYTPAIDRWRKHLHPVTNHWFVLWCKKYLLEFDYQL